MITITGTTSKKLIAYIEKVYSHLNIDDFDAIVDVDIVSKCAANAGGFCDGDDDMVNVEIARYDAYGKIPTKQLMINLAHEMIHAHQIASGRLVNGGLAFRTAEDGSQYMATKQVFEGIDYVGVSYNDQPWEKEAYDAEEEVYEACK